MGRPKGSFSTIDGYILNNLKNGDQFYTAKSDAKIRSLADHYGVKIKTEEVFSIEGNNDSKSLVPLTKVTIL